MNAARFGRAMLVFGALGAAWSAQLASLLRIGCFRHDDGLALIALPFLVPIAMSMLGCALVWIGARPPVIAFVVPATGMMVGVVSGLVWWPEQIASAAVHGLAIGAVALVLLVPLMRTLFHPSRAHSLMDAADRLTTWSCAGMTACASSVLTIPQLKTYPACESDPLQSVVATSVAAGLAVATGVLLVFHARRSRRLLALPWCPVDIGLEDSSEPHLPTAYRHARFSPAVLHATQAQSIFDHRARVAIVCAALSLALAAVAMTARLVDVLV